MHRRIMAAGQRFHDLVPDASPPPECALTTKQKYEPRNPKGHSNKPRQDRSAVSMVLDLRDKCREGLNGQEPCSSSQAYTTATAWRGRRRSVGSLNAILGTNDDRPSATRWARCAADHDCLPAERAYDPAADPSTVAGNAI